MKRYKYLIMFIASMVIWGANGLLVANISLSSAEIVLLRTFLGSLFLIAVVLYKRSFSFSDLKADILPASIGGAALGLNWVFLFAAYRTAGVSLSTLTYYCGPMLVLALSPVLFKEKLTWSKLIAVIAVAIGMLCITGNVELGTEVSKGLVYGGGAALLYAVIIVSSKNVKHLSGLNCAAYELVIAFIVVLLYVVFSGIKVPVIPARSDIVYVLIIGLVSTGLAYYLYFSAMQKLPGQTVALICYIDPLTALLVSAAFLNELLLPVQIIGAVLILGGAVLGELKFKKK